MRFVLFFILALASTASCARPTEEVSLAKDGADASTPTDDVCGGPLEVFPPSTPPSCPANSHAELYGYSETDSHGCEVHGRNYHCVPGAADGGADSGDGGSSDAGADGADD